MSDFMSSYFNPQFDELRAIISTTYQDELNRLAAGENYQEFSQFVLSVPALSRETLFPYFDDAIKMKEWGGQVVFNQVVDALLRRVKIKKFYAGYEINADDLREPAGASGMILTHMEYSKKLANAVSTHPNEIVFSVLRDGMNLECFDGQGLYDTDHPTYNRYGDQVIASNYITGSDPLFLMVNMNGAKPILFQERESPKFYTNESHEFEVALNGKLKYFVTAERASVPFMWQGIQACKGALNLTNLQTMWERMQSLHKKDGTPMNQVPTHLVVPPSLTFAAERLINRELIVESNAAVDNPWKGKLTVMTSQWIA
jgi:phage major head subunit gpT-like protein